MTLRAGGELPVGASVHTLSLIATSSEYADELERAIDDAVSFAESCSAEDWATPVPGEDWPVSVVVHHVALGHDLVLRWIDCALVGRSVEDTREEIDTFNLRHAEESAGVGVAETVELLRTNGAAAVAKIRRLSETDLERTAPFAPADGQPFSVDQFCSAAVGHVRTHLGHARAVVGRADAES
jgi:hypothetical protein